MLARYGIDTGGTFTDLVGYKGGELIKRKVHSTPEDPSRAVLEAMAEGADGAGEVIHGSTVATNALLTRRGAATGMAVTAGFEDIIEIGRQERPLLYDLKVRRPEPLVPREARIGVAERVSHQGEVIRGLPEADLEDARKRFIQLGVRSVAVCFLHSYANPEHERKAAEILRGDGDLFVVASSDVLAEHREFERFTTAVVSASVTPIMAAYLEALEKALGPKIWIMHSGGGVVPAGSVRSEAARTVLSGPAAGVVGGFEAARSAGHDRVITFDMGGTSTDVALCAGALPMANQIVVGEHTISLPSLDILTVGAGGGSVAWVDPGGALRVGPKSAGADPGPVAYGKGDEITVTDANLFLGRIQPGTFLGGEIELQGDRVRSRMGDLARTLGVAPWRAAEGVLEVARAEVGRALRRVSMERGQDPADFALVAFGGAGPLHAVEIAKDLGAAAVIVPGDPGLVSAQGLLASDLAAHASRTLLGSGKDWRGIFADLEERTAEDLGGAREGDRLERFVDMRYRGQSYEIAVPWGPGREERFHEAHGERYGTSDPSRDVEEVCLRLVRRRPVSLPETTPAPREGSASPETVRALFQGEEREIPLYHREGLRAGPIIKGPGLIAEYSSTTYLPPGSRARVGPGDSLILDWKREGVR